MLSEKYVRKCLTDLGSDWELKDGKIVKSFQFSSFVDAVEFVNKVAKIAEGLNHHPIITINWKTIKLSLITFILSIFFCYILVLLLVLSRYTISRNTFLNRRKGSCIYHITYIGSSPALC